ncbi:hypothetical protein [Paraburkholderia caledonica]|uniref:hypothetical protein n=1 Tax=Paraburkholderia caledonica TaxID=134536 RepID=UPI000B405A2B|nr:hypothetical protein [Paraburkholderia caledonica]
MDGSELWTALLPFVRQVDWKVVATSSLISSSVALLVGGLKDMRAHRRERRDAALEVALSLEAYARTCRSMMHKAEWAAREAGRTTSYEPLNGMNVPSFQFPERIQWKWLSHKIASELREFPATVHAAREYTASIWEYGDPVDLCSEVEFECAKSAKEALDLARSTRRKHRAAPWKPGAKDSDLERELIDYISSNGEKRKHRMRDANDFEADLAAEVALQDNA